MKTLNFRTSKEIPTKAVVYLMTFWGARHFCHVLDVRHTHCIVCFPPKQSTQFLCGLPPLQQHRAETINPTMPPLKKDDWSVKTPFEFPRRVGASELSPGYLSCGCLGFLSFPTLLSRWPPILSWHIHIHTHTHTHMLIFVCRCACMSVCM